jgi:hypothetical protein
MNAMGRGSLWARFWERRERELWAKTRQPGLAGALDTPRPCQRFVHGFHLRGWVASDQPVVVAAYLNGSQVWEGEATDPRPDVGPDARQFSAFIVSTRRTPS